jgi:lipopolysaccharide transport system permease protein
MSTTPSAQFAAPPIPQEPSVRPLKTIRAKTGWHPLDLASLWQFRDLLLTLAGRDVKLRYRQTAVGILWVVLQPLLAAGIFSFVFGKVANMPSDGVPYFVFSYTGLLGWTLFSNTVSKVSTSMVQNANLVSKVYFPRLILALSMMFSTIIDFCVALCLLPFLMLVAHVAPGPGIVLLPVLFALILMLALGIGMYLSAIAVSYRDVQYVVPVVMGFLLYACPVAYSITKVPATYREAYFLNPMADLLAAFRWSLLGHGMVEWSGVAYAAVVSVVVFICGAYAFKRMERRFADVI